MAQITFKKASLEEIDNTMEGTRGRVSYPIIKAFMETGLQVAEINQEGAGRKPMTLGLLLRSYTENHQLPVKVLVRRNRIFLIRLDIDENGKDIPDWRQKYVEEQVKQSGDVEDITSAVVERE